MQPLFSLRPVELYTIAFLGSSAIYLVFAFWLKKTMISRLSLRTLLTAGILVRIVLVPLTPVGSDDIYRYIWDGKVQSAGINPYQYAPDAPELAGLHTAELPALVNHSSMKTVYFPLTQWAFWLGYQMAGEHPWGIKLLLLAAELGTLLLLVNLLRWNGVPEKYVLLYALCPLPILMFALDGHIDALGLPVFLLALLFWIRERKVTSLLLFGISMSVKPVALVVLPLLFFREKGLSGRLRVVLLPFVLVALQFLPYVFSANPLESIARFGVHWAFNGALFEVIYMVVANNQLARLVCAILLATGVVALAVRRKDALTGTYTAIFLLLLLSPVVHPWYVSWLAVLLPLVRRWSGILLAATVSLSSLTVMNYRLTGDWSQHPWVLVLEYVPVLAAGLYELLNSPEPV
ncbi:MAG TPA: hypothetical protein VLT13_01615 [Bacteroidota bacterium]|nr:hypothetical protein [Bacteroidota bacterium]